MRDYESHGISGIALSKLRAKAVRRDEHKDVYADSCAERKKLHDGIREKGKVFSTGSHSIGTIKKMMKQKKSDCDALCYIRGVLRKHRTPNCGKVNLLAVPET